jgi:hypothetical protein
MTTRSALILPVLLLAASVPASSAPDAFRYPLVEVRAPRTSFSANIANGRFEMLIASLDGPDTTVLELRLDAHWLLDLFRGPERVKSRENKPLHRPCCDMQ